MKTYEIFNFQTDEIITEIEAGSVLEAERKACKLLNVESADIYALTKE